MPSGLPSGNGRLTVRTGPPDRLYGVRREYMSVMSATPHRTVPARSSPLQRTRPPSGDGGEGGASGFCMAGVAETVGRNRGFGGPRARMAWRGESPGTRQGSRGPSCHAALDSGPRGFAGGPVQPRAGPVDPDITGLVMQRTFAAASPWESLGRRLIGRLGISGGSRTARGIVASG